MSALARVLADQGHIVKGVDVEDYFYTEDNLNNCLIESFNLMHLNPYYFYIIGNAFINHSTVKYIKLMKYHYMEYPKFINWYFKQYNFISVCGSHGKTTTTKMLTQMYDNPSYIIGDGSGSGASNNNFIIESCEYKNTFLNYNPDIALILNIDYDHPDFFKNEGEYIDSFNRFALKSKIVIINGDDKNAKKIIKENYITYGLNRENDIIFTYTIKENKMDINILGRVFSLPYLGKHYAYDFVGAYLLAKLAGIHDDDIANRMKSFKLPKRRMEEALINESLLIHDYAHHPTEIKSVYENIRLRYPNKHLVCFFQPHTITRTVAFKDSFKEALDMFDECYLLSIFTSAREGVNQIIEDDIYRLWGYPLLFSSSIKMLDLKPESIYLFLGAGDIDRVYKELIKIKKSL